MKPLGWPCPLIGGASATELALAAETQDVLIRLVEAIGSLPIDLPDNPVWLRFGRTKSDDLIDHLDAQLGIEVDFPNPFPNEYGVQTKRGVCSYRSTTAIYLAYRARQLLQGVANPRVLEIGPGMGRSAYYAARLGIGHYSVVDLPFPAGVLQSYFLMRTLGPDKVQLSGETIPAASVRVMEPSEFLEGSERYDLIINNDSITEIGHAQASLYFDKITVSTPLMFSINHESNLFRLRDLIAQRRDRISRYDRHPDWLRTGCVEELLAFK